jgi:exodeoxyribonuclease VII small subunit
MANSAPENTPTNFEDALSQLDAIVESLEEEGVPLTDLINHYDRGMKLLEACQSQLENARQRVATISKTYGDAVSDTDSESEAEDLNNELF